MRGVLADIRDGLRGYAGRTLLSGTAIALGMASLTMLLAIIEGLREQARQAIEDLGVHVFALLPAPLLPPRTAPMLSEATVTWLTRNLPACHVSAFRRIEASAGGQFPPLTVIATDEFFATVRGWTVHRGRFLDALDRHTQARTVVITESLARQVGWDVGQTVTIGGVPFTIVGVLAAKGLGPTDFSTAHPVPSLDDRLAFVPRTTATFWRRGHDSPPIDAILVRAPTFKTYAHALSTARRLFSAPNAPPLQWVTPDTLIRPLRRIEKAVGFVAGSVSLLSLALGGVTLMSLMIANVRDRTSEIGLRRALGARPCDVAILFILEGLVVTFAGTLAGVVNSLTILRLFGSHIPLPLSFGPFTWLFPWVAALILSSVCSWVPAYLAARLQPADALRAE